MASMVATKDQTLAAVVIGAGAYDFSAGIRPPCAASTLTSDRRRVLQLKLLELGLPYIMSTRLRLRFFCCTALRTSGFRYGRRGLFLKNFDYWRRSQNDDFS